MNEHPSDDRVSSYVNRHLTFGWWAVLLFLTLGLVLEAMHGFKIGWYLNVSSEGRRLVLRLAHAHGVLIGLVNVAFAVTLAWRPDPSLVRTRIASAGLIAANLLLPGGFLLGGLFSYGSEPGMGILLVPPGGAILFASVLLIAVGRRGGNRDRGDVERA